MSQTTIPFQPAAVADDAAEPEFATAGRNTRVLLVLGVVGALVVLAIAGYFLLFAGGESTETAVSPEPQAAAPVAPAPGPAVPAKVTPSRVTEKSFGRDPFKVLIVDSVAVTSTAGAAAPATAGTTPATTGTTAPASATPHRFAVVSVASNNKTIVVKVDGVTYESLKAGEVFAEVFQVRFIGGASNSFQIGDEVFNVIGKKAVSISG